MRNKAKFIILVSSAFILASCGETEHVHTYESEWTNNETEHWHKATCGHDLKKSKGFHSFGDYVEKNGVKKVTCNVCGYEKDYNPNDVEHSDGFSEVTEFDDVVEIHTAQQKEYLNYDGEYATMPRDKYPDGSKTISDPVKSTISWEFDEHDNVSKYSVTIGTKEDLSDGFEIIGTKEKSIDAYNFFLGTNYYRINAYLDDDTKVGSDVYSLTVDSTVPRNLYVGERMTNCRDVGGKDVESGGTLRQGLLYRTCGSGYDYGTGTTEEGLMILKDQLKVKTEINLNDSNSYLVNVDGTTVYNTYMDYAKVKTDSKHHFSRNAENVRNVFDILSKKENYPVFYHCRIGTDRTGLVSILANGVLGVPLNKIYQDYLFSNFGKIGEKRNIGGGDADDITNYMKEIMAMPGDTFQEKVYNTLLTIGVTPEIIESFKDIMIDGAKADNSKGQVVVNAKDMTLNGTTLQTEDKSSLISRNAPASSCTLSANATATSQFVLTAGEKNIYAYLGHKESSSTKKIETSISVTLDGNDVSIPAISFKDAGMGKCDSRTNYYFVKLGTVNVNGAGQHTLVVKGLQNDMILGNIAVF